MCNQLGMAILDQSTLTQAGFTRSKETIGQVQLLVDPSRTDIFQVFKMILALKYPPHYLVLSLPNSISPEMDSDHPLSDPNPSHCYLYNQ